MAITGQAPATCLSTRGSHTLSKVTPGALRRCYYRFQSTSSTKWNIAKMMSGWCHTLKSRLISGYSAMTFVEPSCKIIASIKMMESMTRGFVIMRRHTKRQGAAHCELKRTPGADCGDGRTGYWCRGVEGRI